MTQGWFYKDKLASELCQITAREYCKFDGTDLLDVHPVIVPRPDNVEGANDYYMWPIATMVEGNLVVLYQRTPCHWGPDLSKRDENSGIRMVVSSPDGGLTWSDPVDVLQAGSWSNTPFKGFGGGLGTHEGIVYLALNQGVYRSTDRGETWRLVACEPDFSDVPGIPWAPGTRLTFDDLHGLTIWTTSGFSEDAEERRDQGKYGTHLVAVYSPDFGETWHYRAQALPAGLRLSEVTPLRFEGKMAFFLRNGLRNTRFGQGYSDTGWFPFEFALSDVGPVGLVDTPDLNYNPVTKRLEAAAPHRMGGGPGPQGQMKVNLYSISPADLAAGSQAWRSDGTLIRYRHVFGESDGFNAVGSVVDVERHTKLFHVWGGDCTGRAGIYQYSVSLDTPAVSEYLTAFYGPVQRTAS